MIETQSKVGIEERLEEIEGNFLNLIKSIYKTTAVVNYWMFSPQYQEIDKDVCSYHTTQYYTGGGHRAIKFKKG